ncbi:MAG: hypothetical protein J0L52_08860 [Caulobacterales bacterium]|nr:hypothetical protein [Caulobacterales bacterium]
MAAGLSLRHSLIEAGCFTLKAWRIAPLACGLMTLAFLFPVFLSARTLSLEMALPLIAAQAGLALIGWTGLLRAAQGRAGLGEIGLDALRVMASGLLNGLFLVLVGMVLTIVLLGIAGATGLAPGDDLTMATQAVVSSGGWKTLVLLVVEIAAAMLVLSLSARLLVSGPATIVEGRVVSLAALGWTRGSGLRPAAGLVTALLPYIVLAVSALLIPSGAAWIDVAWAFVLGFIQMPLLAGYATGLWRTSFAPKDPI